MSDLTTQQQKALALARARKRRAEQNSSNASETEKPNAAMTVIDQGVQGATFGFGDEVSDFFGAAGATLLGSGSLGDNLKTARSISQNRLQEQREERPLLSTGANIAGAGAAGAGTAATKGGAALTRALASGSLPARAGKGALAGGASGAAFGAGTSQDRAGGAATGAVLGAGLGGLFAPITAAGAQGVGAVSNAVRNIGRKGSVNMAQEVPSEASKIAMKQGRKVPLTKGQATQDPRLQALESTSLRGGFGDEAQSSALQGQSIQQSAIRDTLDTIAPQTEDAVGAVSSAVNRVQNTAKSQKNRIRRLYQIADERGAGVKLDTNVIRSELLKDMESVARQGKFDLARAPTARRELTNMRRLLTGTDNAKPTQLRLRELENFRSRITQASDDAFRQGNGNEGQLLAQMRESYDSFMENYADEALKQGDPRAIEAFQRARAARKRYGLDFERSNDVVKKLVQDPEMTPEKATNLIIGSGKLSSKVSSGNVIKALKKAAGGQSEAVVQDIKTGAMARIMQRAKSNTVDAANLGEDIISPTKLSKEINTMLDNNATFAREVFSADEVKTLRQLGEDLRLISSQQPGTVNYSNTAIEISRMMQRIPGLNFTGADTLVRQVGNSVASRDLQRSLGELSGGLKRQGGASTLIGGVAGGAAAGNLARE